MCCDLCARPPYLVGFSLGGYLCFDWVAKNSGSVCGLLAASCGAVPHRIVFDPWRVLARVIHTLPDRGRALNDFAVKALVPLPGAEDVIAGGVGLEVMDDVLRDLLTLEPLHSLRSIDVTVLFVHGRSDHVRLNTRRFLAATAQGRLVTIPGASYMASVVRPREFTAALLDGYVETTPASFPIAEP